MPCPCGRSPIADTARPAPWIAHRKPENCLLFDTSPRSLVKLCDFGLSKMLHVPKPLSGRSGDLGALAGVGSLDEASPTAVPREASRAAVMRSRVGSQVYASPELLREEPYDKSIDLWGLGHIIFTALTGHHAFDNSMDMFGDIVGARVAYSEPIWQQAPEAANLCRVLLCADPSGRPTPDMVLGHVWLATAANRSKISRSLRYLGRVESLRGVCLRVLESVMSDAESAELRREFDSLDSDAKGYLNASDVRRALKRGHKKAKRKGRRESEQSPRHKDYCGDDMSSGGEPPHREGLAAEESLLAPHPAPPGLATSLSFSSGALNVHVVLRSLLANALAESGGANESGGASRVRKHRGRSARPTRGARRVGVVSFSMFAEAALEVQPSLIRRLWADAFARMDADGDGIVSGLDLLHCLRTLGIGQELSDEARTALLREVDGNSSSEQLLKHTLDAKRAAAGARMASL